MVDYVELLRADLLEQFKEKPVIDALMEAIGEQLNDLRQFFEDLRDRRGLLTSNGKQLDGVGNIVVLSRMEAGELACVTEPVYVMDDETYRKFLIYKVWKNTNKTTYFDVIKALRMFWDRPLYYSEDPAEPATMIFETDVLGPDVDVNSLLTAPLIKAAGVGIKVKAYTETPMEAVVMPISGYMGRGYMSTVLPPLEEDTLPDRTLRAYAAMDSITATKLPEYDPLGDLTARVQPAAPVAHSITKSKLPEMEE